MARASFSSSDHQLRAPLLSLAPWVRLPRHRAPEERSGFALTPVVCAYEGPSGASGALICALDIEARPRAMSEVSYQGELSALALEAWRAATRCSPLYGLNRHWRVAPSLEPRLYQIPPSLNHELSALAISGPSLGLALGLAYSQQLMGLRLCDDALCSATLNARGEIGPVGQLTEKLGALARFPALRRVIVAEAQREEAARALKERGLEGLELISASNLKALLERLVGDAERALWRARCVQRAQPAALRALSERALWGAGVSNQAAHLALLELSREALTEAAPPALVAKLSFAEHSARRHLGQAHSLQSLETLGALLSACERPALNSPLTERLSGLAEEERLGLWAHLTQGVVDLSGPRLEGEERARLERFEGGLREAWAALEVTGPLSDGAARLLGARCRYLFTQGHAEALIEPLIGLTLGWRASLSGARAQLSYPLSLCYQVVASLDAPARRAPLRALDEALPELLSDGVEPIGAGYVLIQRCKAWLRADERGRRPAELADEAQLEAQRVLCRLWARTERPDEQSLEALTAQLCPTGALEPPLVRACLAAPLPPLSALAQSLLDELLPAVSAEPPQEPPRELPQEGFEGMSGFGALSAQLARWAELSDERLIALWRVVQRSRLQALPLTLLGYQRSREAARAPSEGEAEEARRGLSWLRRYYLYS